MHEYQEKINGFKEWVSNVPKRMLIYFQEAGKDRIELVDFSGKYNSHWSIVDYVVVGISALILIASSICLTVLGAIFVEEQHNVVLIVMFVIFWFISAFFFLYRMYNFIKGFIY